jgi:hypothetical protein
MSLVSLILGYAKGFLPDWPEWYVVVVVVIAGSGGGGDA